MILSLFGKVLAGSPHTRLSVRRAAVLSAAAAVLLATANIGVATADGSSGKNSKPPEKTEVVPVRSVLVFPTDTKGGVSDQVGDDIMNVEKSRLSLAKIYSPIEFLTSIPTVKLALNEQTLNQNDVKKPFDSDSKLKKLSGVTGYDLVLVSSIDDYEYDSAKNQVSVVMSARLIDYSGAKSVVRSAAQSATSPAGVGNMPELKVATALVRGLMDKLMTAIITPKPTTTTTTK